MILVCAFLQSLSCTIKYCAWATSKDLLYIKCHTEHLSAVTTSIGLEYDIALGFASCYVILSTTPLVQ